MDIQGKLQRYNQTLSDWIKESGFDKQKLARLTTCFHLDPKQTSGRELPDYSLSKVINARSLPVRREGIYNLLKLLSVLYSLNVITREEFLNFLSEYEIFLPNGDIWEVVWQHVENGKTCLHSLLASKMAKSSLQQKPSRRRFVWMFILFAILISASFLTLTFLRRDASQLPTSTPSGISCLTPIQHEDPVFLPDQGFSLYQVSSRIPGSSILGNQVRSVGLNEQGLWVGYAPSAEVIDRVSLYDRDNWKHYCLGISLNPGQNINDTAFFGNKFYIATDGAGIGEFDGAGWTFSTADNDLLSNSFYQLTIANDGLWGATYEGVAHLDNGRWKTVYRAEPGGLISNHIYKFFEDNAGNKWFGTINQGISRLSPDGQWFSYYADDPNHLAIRGIVEDDDHGVWFATDRGGLLRYREDSWSTFTVTESHLPSDQVYDVGKDRYGRIWAATERGVAYTADYGQTWTTHSTMSTLAIAFGCSGCPYDENHVWLVLKDHGLGHVRIPPQSPTMEIVSVPKLVQLRPGETYIFEITVNILSEQLTPVDGDSLRSVLPNDTFLYGAYPIIPIESDVTIGKSYTFTNAESPIIAPDKPGIYRIPWRIWQGRRFVSDPIIVEFEVVTNK